MVYLDSFEFAGEHDELSFKFKSQKLDMACYDVNNIYPFNVLTHKLCEPVYFEPITVFYGGNGSGKSTALNIIAEKLGINRTTPFNTTPFMKDYLRFCRYELANPRRGIPRASEIITSDGVFERLLDDREKNSDIDRDREELFGEYTRISADSRDNGWQMRSMEDYDELKLRCEVMRKSKAKFTAERMKVKEVRMGSNGESAFRYFTDRIRDDTLYLLDEPENSLSAALQAELAEFLLNQARFYGCQFIISTHSPFILSIRGARIYDLDSIPSKLRRWNELPNVRAYFDLFMSRREDFDFE